MKGSPSGESDSPEKCMEIVDEWFICDQCGKERDRGGIRGCGRRMIKLCSGCIKEIEEDGHD